MSDLVGKGKYFEPPFKVEDNFNKDNAYVNIFIVDKNGKVLFEKTYCERGEKMYIHMTMAQNIVDLLNRENL